MSPLLPGFSHSQMLSNHASLTNHPPVTCLHLVSLCVNYALPDNHKLEDTLSLAKTTTWLVAKLFYTVLGISFQNDKHSDHSTLPLPTPKTHLASSSDHRGPTPFPVPRCPRFTTAPHCDHTHQAALVDIHATNSRDDDISCF